MRFMTDVEEVGIVAVFWVQIAFLRTWRLI